MATNPTSSLAKYVFQSFNLLDPNIAKDLNQIINNLYDIRSSNDIDPSVIQTQTQEPITSAVFKSQKSEQATFERIAASFGISGSYGFYSGSLQASVKSQKFKASTAFSSSSVGTVQVGTVRYAGESTDIIKYLKKEVVKQLQGISSLKDAKEFIDIYGTHVALGWNLGGSFSIHIEVATTTYDHQLSISTKVNAAYSGVSTVEASASAAYDLNKSGIAESHNISHYTVGGSANAAGFISLTEPNSNINKWIQSCTPDTTYGLQSSVSFADLAKNAGFTKAGNFLQMYYDLFILKYSLENPSIFSNHKIITPLTTTSVSVQANSAIEKNNQYYKILSGGGKLKIGGHNFLTGTYPEFGYNSGSNFINGWTATSHDNVEPSHSNEYLTVYALGVYDPGNYLQVQASTAQGTNPGIGGDEAVAKLESSLVLVGGGCKTQIVGTGDPKYLISTAPTEPNFTSWYSNVSDYRYAASDVKLTSYAIGIKTEGLLTIKRTVSPNQSVDFQHHGNQVAKLSYGLNVVGGGLKVVKTDDGYGNLAQQTFPSANNAWTEYNTDYDSHNSLAKATAFAIGLSVSIDGL